MNQGKTLQRNAVLLQSWVSQAVPLSYGAVIFAGSVPFPAGDGQAVLCLVGSGMQYSSGGLPLWRFLSFVYRLHSKPCLDN